MNKKWVILVLITHILTVSINPVLASPDEGSFIPCIKKNVAVQRPDSFYTVRKGDTLWGISKTLNLDLKLIMSTNGLNDKSILRIGQSIKVSTGSNSKVHLVNKGDTMWSIAANYGVSLNELQGLNKSKNPSRLEIGEAIVIPAGTQRLAKTSQETSRGFNISRSFYAWPLFGTITSRYGWRKSGFHHGLDIAGKTGTPIKAAAAGEVSFVGYKSIYGRTVILEHSNGEQSLYAHASKTLVNQGQKVRQGETIAAVGSSGRTTGPHLHFEIRKGDKTFNPLEYLR
ncbi:MAG: M23 family metallopeptidase [Syntrophomonadaceae bacterium]|nr:M23 family metallopeptidase [Syntrophomonadaceae bacterium]MDD3024189.1 M23 family metallopeptidase [Syntrophomonadaceae bacterium]